MPVPSGDLRVGRGSGPRRGAPRGEGVPDDGPARDGNVSDAGSSALGPRAAVAVPPAILGAGGSGRGEERPGPQLVHARQRPARHAPRRLVVSVRRPQRAERPDAIPDCRAPALPADERAAEPASGGVREQHDAGARGVGRGRLLDGALGEVEVPAVGLLNFFFSVFFKGEGGADERE